MHDHAAAALAGQDLLLVLDNCEHVVDDVIEFVDRLLQLSDTPAVLANSREGLEIDGERRYRVSPLEVGGGDAPSPAVELFVQRATAAGGEVAVADPAVRARRRWQDLKKAGLDVSYERVLHEQGERDVADSQRDVAPLAQARDAVVVDTSSLTIAQVVDAIVELCLERSGGTAK